MRRLVVASLTAVLSLPLAAPRAASGQFLATVGRFNASGCVTGPVYYDPVAGTSVFGQVACLSGPASLNLFAPNYPGQGGTLTLVGSFAITYNPAFQGNGIGLDGGTLSYTFAPANGRPCGTASVCSYSDEVRQIGGFPGAFDFRVNLTPPVADLVLNSVMPTTARLDFAYRDPNPHAFGTPAYAEGIIAFTATPEPATLALTLGGLAVVGVGAWRRRRV